MRNVKRVVITSVVGLILGFVSWAVCNFVMGHTQPASINLVMILFNVLLGFTIGISSLRWHWIVHGLVLGGFFGVILGFVSLGQGTEFIWPLIFGLVYGFVIELVATVVLKAGIASAGAA